MDQSETSSLTAELYQARALYEFVGNTENELPLQRGEIVDVLEEDEPWAFVRNSNDADGYVPLNYLIKVTEPADQPPAPPRPIIKNPTDRATTGIDLPPTPTTHAPLNVVPGKQGIFSRPKAESMDVNSPYLDIFACAMEWWACITLFVSGLLTVIWGSAEVPEDTLDETLGALQSLGAGILVAYFSIYRNSLCGDRAAIFRGVLLFLMSALGWLSLPLGVVGAGALIPASAANFVAYCHGSDAQNHSDWLTLGLNVKALAAKMCKNPIAGCIFFIVIVGMNFGYFMLGLYLGQIKIDDAAEDRVLLGEAWKYAEAWGTIIACNMALAILFSMRISHDYLKEWAELHAEDTDCCKKCLTRTINWASEESLFFLHKVLAGTMLIAAFMHVFECINVYHSSGASRDYIGVFGDWAFASGVPMIWCLAIIFAIYPVWDPVREEGHRGLSHISYACWILAAVTPFFWGTNYWKFVSGPLFLYSVDKAFRRLVVCCDNVIEPRESEYR